MNTPAVPLPLPQGAARLTDWGVIRAQGEDARRFLHGQLTQDIEHLDERQACLAGYCSAKGRLLATFVVWRRSPEEVLLACSADLLPAVLKRLNMFVLRAKCKLSDATAEWPLWGVAGEVPGHATAAVWSHASAGDHDLVRLPDARVGSATVLRHLWAGATPPAVPAMALDDWSWLEVHSGVARVVAATSEQFVPQMVNLELVGGVNFKKGCYPGQEVVARSQYRGTLKRRAYVLAGAAALQPGQEVFDQADPGQPAGMVVLAASRGGSDHAVLAEVKIAAVQAGGLHALSADGPALSATEQPYPLPAEAA